MSYLPILILFVLFFLNVPVVFALIASAMSYFIFLNTTIPVNLVIQNYITSLESFPLLAIPFFIMAGSLMNYSGISASFMKMAEVITGHMVGGLAQVNVFLSLLMGGISGSANADAAMQSKILVPEMKKRGYGTAFSAAITAASSTVSPIIPPGIDLIIYALLANVSVGKMFIAGYTPGVLMALALMITVNFISKRRKYLPSRSTRAKIPEIAKQLLESSWALVIPFGIILGMRFGAFTPTEAGAVAVVFCIVVGTLVYKQLRLKHLIPVLKETIYGTSAVLLLIVGAKIFGYYLNLERIPQGVTELLISISDNKFVILLLINALLLFLGMFIEGGAAMIILIPLLLPAVQRLDIDLIHFGIIIIINIMIGGITPPFGSMMFTVCSIIKVKLQDFMREIIPFLIALIIVLLLFTYIPQLGLFIPNLIYGG